MGYTSGNSWREGPTFWRWMVALDNDDIVIKSIVFFILVLGIWVIRVAIPDAKVPHFGSGCLLSIMMIYMVYMVYMVHMVHMVYGRWYMVFVIAWYCILSYGIAWFVLYLLILLCIALNFKVYIVLHGICWYYIVSLLT